MKKKVVVLILFFILFCIYLTYPDKEYIDDEKKVNIVVSRYNEELDFLFLPPFSSYEKITCYNKGVRDPISGYPPNCEVIDLPNVGRCDHTYLHHIISNYDNLDDITIFLPASCTYGNKIHLTKYVFDRVNRFKTTVLTHKRPIDYLYFTRGFYLNSYQASAGENKSLNPESELLKSPLRPFGKWYDHNFPERKGKPLKYMCYTGIFAVSKEDILKNPIEKYKQLISYLDTHSNPEVGHYMERSWGALFYKN